MKESFKFFKFTKNKGSKNLFQFLIKQIKLKYKFCQALFHLQFE